jgi:hypothetical protein
MNKQKKYLKKKVLNQCFLIYIYIYYSTQQELKCQSGNAFDSGPHIPGDEGSNSFSALLSVPLLSFYLTTFPAVQS